MCWGVVRRVGLVQFLGMSVGFGGLAGEREAVPRSTEAWGLCWSEEEGAQRPGLRVLLGGARVMPPGKGNGSSDGLALANHGSEMEDAGY